MQGFSFKNQVINEKDSLLENIIDFNGPFEKLSRVKNFIDRIFLEGGYLKSPSSQNLDPWSTWIYLTNSREEIISAQRIVEKSPENQITIEQAFISGEKPEKHYSVVERNVADWNSVAFEHSKLGFRAALLNAGYIARHCLERKYDLVFGFSNEKKRGIERLYLSHGAQFSKKYPKPVYFPEDRLEGKTFELKIIEIDKGALQNIAAKFQYKESSNGLAYGKRMETS